MNIKTSATPSTEPDTGRLIERIDRLERAQRRSRGVIALALIVIAGAMLAGQDAREQDDEPNAAVEGDSLVLRTERGVIYAHITHTPERGAELALHDGRGVARVRLGVSGRHEPRLELTDLAGVVRLEASVLDDATPRILLRDASDTERAKMLLMPDGSPLIYLKDHEGRNRVELAHLNAALSGLVVFDEQSRTRMVGGATGLDRLSLQRGWVLLDETGAIEAAWGVDAEGQRIDGPVETDG